MFWFLGLVALLAVFNVVGAVVIVVDKRAARRGARRVRELNLHVMGLLGAWPAMALAMQAVRHKTRKRSFLMRFVVASLFGTVLWFLLLQRASL